MASRDGTPPHAQRSVMITSTPEFQVAMRGYDRSQVDSYVEDLRLRLDAAERKAATTTAEQPKEQAEEAKPRRGGDPNLAALGERITQILQLAEDEAAERRERGERDAAAILQQAQSEADRIRQAARN